jgi:hypothetical protein
VQPRQARSSRSAHSAYHGATFALLTQHGKEHVIGPAFDSAFAARAQLVLGFDTDSLGTFTHEVPRAGSQLEAVRTKARIGMELSGLPLGLASEGSFGAGPLGFFSSNLELVILLDAERRIEIVGRAHAPAQHARTQVATHSALDDAARSAGFPAHGLVLRAESHGSTQLRKGLCSWSSLHAAFEDLQSSSPDARIFVENDLRAHMNPTRMETIEAATADLIQRMLRECPACRSPGFGLITNVPGLPCRDCGSATHDVCAEQHGCVACEQRELREVTALYGDPSNCDSCNP